MSFSFQINAIEQAHSFEVLAGQGSAHRSDLIRNHTSASIVRARQSQRQAARSASGFNHRGAGLDREFDQNVADVFGINDLSGAFDVLD